MKRQSVIVGLLILALLWWLYRRRRVTGQAGPMLPTSGKSVPEFENAFAGSETPDTAYKALSSLMGYEDQQEIAKDTATQLPTGTLPTTPTTADLNRQYFNNMNAVTHTPNIDYSVYQSYLSQGLSQTDAYNNAANDAWTRTV